MICKVTPHSPTLQSVIMVEETIEKYSGDFGKYQLWQKLPRKMMYQTFLIILKYLLDSNKILIDNEGRVVWIWNPKLIRELRKNNLIVK
jgi:hypothetical protein